MKKSKYLFIFILTCFIVPSCVDDTAPEDAFGAGKNFVGFKSTTQSISAVTDGNEYTANIPIMAFGPSITEVDGSITATVSVDPSSTAIEGTHFKFNSKEITLSSEGDFLGVLPITIITEGIAAPLDENPKLVLNVNQVSGNPNVIASGKKITASIFYLCYSDLTGTYSVTIDNDRCKNAPYGPNFPFEVEIAANADGSWHLSSADGGFLGRCTGNAGFDNAGNIVELCGDIPPTDDLDYGADGIGMITGGSWDAANGILVLTHEQSFSANWPAEWTSTYVRQ